MSHHISPVDCAPVTPLVSLSSQLSSMNAHLQDISHFAAQSKNGAALSAAVAPLLHSAQSRPTQPLLAAQPLRPAAVRVDASHADFVSQFNNGLRLDTPHAATAMHLLQHQHQHQHQHQQQQQLAGAQAEELERIYRQHAATPKQLLPPHTPHQHQLPHSRQQQQHPQSLNWAAEFQPPTPAHSLHRLHGQIVQQTPQWAAEFEALKQQQQPHAPHSHAYQQPYHPSPAMQSALLPARAMLPPSSYSAPYSMQRPMLPYMPPASLFSQQVAAQTVAPSHFTPPAVQQQSAPEAASEEASALASNVHSVPEADMVNSFPASSVVSGESQQSVASDGLGGGLNADMIDALLRSDDPKWRQSKFLQFISKIKSGQIEFRDNQAVDRGAAQADATATSEQSQPAAGGAQWADEFSSAEQSQSSFPSDWSVDFEQREGMRGLSTADELARMAAGWSEQVSADAADEAVWESEYRRVVQGDGRLHEAGEADGLEDEKEWAEQFQQHSDFDSFSNINWREALEKAKAANSGATVELEGAAADPQYHFASPTQNSHSDANAAYEEGVRLLERGELKAAIAAFETAVQLDAEHSEAWCQLGAAQAENEEESNAIAALLRAVSIDPYNLKALMMLGVSYTNDLEESRALQYLKTWLENNPDYAVSSLSSPLHSDSAPPLHSVSSLHDQVARMFHSAVSQHPGDADLHTVMGVLSHLSSDFDRAVESFRLAIKQRPNDATLWNKLGATLANSSRSSDALHAYQRALQLRPTYVRAMANLAISFANMGQHDEAVAVYLRVLHANSAAQHVWSYLRISLAHLGKEQLVKLTDSKNVELFRAYYEF